MIRKERNSWAALSSYLCLESGRQSCLKAEARLKSRIGEKEQKRINGGSKTTK